jgi:outer membrane protein OmpA-like peptidoglycan-associated protein
MVASFEALRRPFMSRILLAGTALAAALVAHPSNAQFYIGAAGGLTQTRDFSGPDVGTLARANDHKIEFDRGWVGSLSAGYKFDYGMRVEGEIAQRRSNVDSVTGFGASEDASGRLRVNSAMLNAIYELNTGSAFMPYIGAGFGRAQLRLSDVRDPVNATINRNYSGNDSVWAYQIVGGLAYALTPEIALTADYRYFAGLGNVSYSSAGTNAPVGNNPGRVGDADLRNHSVLVGLRYTFGAPAPMAAPAPAPAPAPVVAPAAAPVRQTQTFLVFFDWDSANLTAAARDTITTAVNAIRAGGNARIEVVGHTDTSGSPQYNQRLGQRRADAVRTEMTRLGVAANAITTRSAGETQLRVPTADNVREAQNRRAEIILPPS